MTRTLPATPRKRPRQARALATVEALLQATAQVLVEEGYEAATTQRIADVAGVSIGSVYQYYPDKRSLVRALVERHEAQVLEQLARTAIELAGVTLEEAVRTYVRRMLQAHSEAVILHRVLTQEITKLYDFPRLMAWQRQAEGLVRAYLEQHQKRLRPKSLDLAAFMLVTTVEGVTHRAILDRPQLIDDERFAEEVSELVLRYLVRR